MNRRVASRRPSTAGLAMRRSKPNYSHLLKAIEAANTQMVGRAAAVVNQALVLRNWMIGAHIVEYEQGGADRARYGARLLERLAGDLAVRGIKGCSQDALERMRSLFVIYPGIGLWISAPAVRESLDPPPVRSLAISAPVVRKSSVPLPTPLDAETVLRLSWSHLIELLRLDDPWKRAFYENECLNGNWSKRQLQRQIESLLYERTGLSTNKRAVIERARRQGAAAPPDTIAEMIRDPYVLEFTGLAERPEYSEDDLERALLDHLQRFLLELGAGFCFEARQFRIAVNNKHDRVDLVFYHRRLRCHVLLDLKIRAFRHADAGQMNFYLNWFKANMTADGDNPPVGIILCSNKDGTEVEFATAGMDNRLFVSRYRTALPSAEQLRDLVDGDRARFAREYRKIGRTK